MSSLSEQGLLTFAQYLEMRHGVLVPLATLVMEYCHLKNGEQKKTWVVVREVEPSLCKTRMNPFFFTLQQQLVYNTIHETFVFVHIGLLNQF